MMLGFLLLVLACQQFLKLSSSRTIPSTVLRVYVSLRASGVTQPVSSNSTKSYKFRTLEEILLSTNLWDVIIHEKIFWGMLLKGPNIMKIS
jgi:hypothetical protein